MNHLGTALANLKRYGTCSIWNVKDNWNLWP